MKSKGLGDTIAKITKATGIEWAVKNWVGDCGCSDRQKWLNEKFPYEGSLTEEEADQLREIFSGKKEIFNGREAQVMFTIYNRVFNKRRTPAKCQSCNKEVVKSLLVMLEKHDGQLS